MTDSLTPEMIEAGVRAFPEGETITNDEYVSRIYPAMKALDPEVERMRSLLTNPPTLPLVYDTVQLSAFNQRFAGWQQEVAAALTSIPEEKSK